VVIRLGFVAILLGGIGLRLYGLDFGLPFLYDPDEIHQVTRANHMLGSGDFNPHWFGHPGTVTLYSLALSFAAYSGLALSLGWFDSVAQIKTSFLQDPSDFFYLGRLVMVVFGGATLALTFAVARRLANPWVALLAMALLAVMPLHAHYSQLIRSESQVTFLILASLWFALSVAERGLWRDYLLAGMFLGLAVATKYPAVMMAVAISVAHGAGAVARGGGIFSRFPRLLGAGAASLVGAFIGSPYLFLDFATVLDDVASEARSYHLGHTSEGFLQTLAWYLMVPLRDSLTVFGLGMAAVGIWACIRSARRAAWVLPVFPLVFVIFLAGLNLVWARWTVPMLPFVAILAAMGFGWLVQRLPPGIPPAVRLPGAVLIGALWLSAPLAATLVQGRMLANDDTRTIAWHWIVANVPEGAKLLVERYSPQLPNGRYRLFGVENGQIVPFESLQGYVIPVAVVGHLRDPALLYTSGMDYVVLASDYDRRLGEADYYARDLEIYRYIFDRFERVFEIQPQPGLRRGHPVQVYRVIDPTD
jgi:hypothetical protein